MTTIAYKDDVIAYDSRACAGDLITSDCYDKHIVRDDVHFFLAGCVSDHEILIDAYFANDRTGLQIADAGSILVDSGEVFYFSCDKIDGYWKQPLKGYPSFAIGSGNHFALTAMDLGCDAAEAVRAAAKRDVSTGGEINIYEVNSKAACNGQTLDTARG
ncbi:MAG: hypothetical protein AB2765_17640 [Candidatus Thiodiazotropha endolucinida]